MSSNACYSIGAMGLFSPIQPWLSDPEISEIVLNRPQEIWIEKHGEFERHPVQAFTEPHLSRLFQLIANENQQELSDRSPLLSGSLSDGSRIQLCLPGVAKFHTFAIRRKVVKSLSLDQYEALGFYDEAKVGSRFFDSKEDELSSLYEQRKFPQFIRAAIRLKKNMVISGGTSSGKTTFLNACLMEIPCSERLVILEDTRELEAPHLNQVQLLALKGKQASLVNMQELVQASLRLRPDRILMGEIRGAEILDFVSACSTGHEGSMTSIHASHPEMAFRRMVQMVKLNRVPSMTDQDILEMLRSVIDVVIQLCKTPRGRRVREIFYSTAS